jgi:hypothetical protein
MIGDEHPHEAEPSDEPVEDDLLAPSAKPFGDPVPGRNDDEEEDGPEQEKRPRDPSRSLIRVGWAMVAVVAVVGAILVAELVRISSVLNNTECLQRAQASNGDYVGPGVKASEVALARLSLRLAVAKCGQ